MNYKTGILLTIYLGILTNVAGQTPIKIQVRRGQPATLMCFFHDIDAPANTLIRWKSAKDDTLTSGMIVHKHQSNLEVQKLTQHDWNLIIKKVDDSFAGNYTCATDTGIVIAQYILEIVEGPRIIQERSSASLVKFSERSTPELICHFSGVPTPEVRWYRGSRDAVDTGITGEILRFPEVTRYASDTYLCEGKNFVGSLNYTIDLQVNFPVEVDVMAEVINASEHEVVTFACVVQGQPINDAYWRNKIGNKIEKEDWQFEVTTEKDGDIPVWFITATFKVGTLGFHDFGDYTCVGEGDSSRATKVTRLVKKPASG